MSTNALPITLGRKVTETQDALRELVGRCRAIRQGVDKEKDAELWTELNGLYGDFCVALAAANAAASTLGALNLTGQVEQPKDCRATQLELHRMQYEKPACDRRMMAANDHTLEEDL